ncbi:MAG: hypothetical protein AAF223_01680 [Bacteroidota bacterium]
MKYLNLLPLALTGILLLSGCQSDDTSTMFPVSKRPTPGDWAPTLATPIPPTSVEGEMLEGAKRWVITFKDIDYDVHYLYQRFFSTPWNRD